MPDFDTRRPQEPEQPGNTNMTRRLGIGVSILLLAILAVVTTIWAAKTTTGPSADQPDQEKAQLDQELQLKPPPAFYTEDESDSSAVPCEPEGLGYPSFCYTAHTEATDTMKLASIVEDVSTDPASFDPAWLDDNHDYLLQVWFVDESELSELP